MSLLKKGINGLKQAPRHCQADHRAYIHSNMCGQLAFIAVYVDSLVDMTKETAAMSEVKKQLMPKFEMKDMGAAHDFLGMEIVQNRKNKTTSLSQKR